ncbi:peptidoglycan-binding protein [Roseovarius spongiae]|uniref:Peptidoglycan-binding protein n=2 Tax=Roseovarius spongiae TaxID=2320272 RepID=A0A3A8AT60_9RHOB|nr:peptidoglycan-binding protein [Roseovarius spongiae]
MAASLLGACDAASPDAGEPDLLPSAAEAPPGAAPGTCWGKAVTPAVIETVTDHVMLQPAEVLEDGTVVKPAAYRTETRQAIVQDRRVTWFETPCAADRTPEFVASLQRALRARGLYRGTITGEMDAPTRAAVRRYQAPEGLDSGVLSLSSARRLGLVAVERPSE